MALAIKLLNVGQMTDKFLEALWTRKFTSNSNVVSKTSVEFNAKKCAKAYLSNDEFSSDGLAYVFRLPFIVFKEYH